MKFIFPLIISASFFFANPSYAITTDYQCATPHDPFLLEIYDCEKLILVVGSNPRTGGMIAVQRSKITAEYLPTWHSIKKESERVGKFVPYQIREEADCD